MLLCRLNHPAAQTGSLLRRGHREHPEVAAFAAYFRVDRGNDNIVGDRNQKLTGAGHRLYLRRTGSLTFQEYFDRESLVNQRDDSRLVFNARHADHHGCGELG